MKFRPYTPEEDQVIFDFGQTLSLKEIGKLINRTSGSVGSRARKIGVSLMKHGENHHRAVHSNDDVRLVRALVDDGELTHKQISEVMEISINTVKLISYDKTRTQDHI
ncbi:hypothetical protein [Vibrio parahaemolyticus]|uniref:hypothetical protein n=1 Tax=Vibrio parahaemolyticus TaxID=670 RepID=UPI00387B8923